jgi:hypothetical protein
MKIIGKRSDDVGMWLAVPQWGGRPRDAQTQHEIRFVHPIAVQGQQKVEHKKTQKNTFTYCHGIILSA